MVVFAIDINVHRVMLLMPNLEGVGQEGDMNSKFRIFVISLFTLVVPFIANADPAVSSGPFKVGVILPLTGPVAEYGKAVQNGMALASEESAEISRNCSFVVEDSQYDPKTAVGLFRKLTTVDKASVIYNWGGPTSDALAPLADPNDVALFVWSADPRVSEGRSRVIRFSNSGMDYGGTIAAYLMKRGYKKIGIVKTNNQYIDAILSGVTSSAPSLHVETIDAFQPGDQDFRSTVSKLRAHRYDVLGVFLLSGQVSQFVKQLRAQSVDTPLFGADFLESMTEVQQSNGGLVGAVFANNEVSEKFRDRYTARFGNELQINHAANGYDFANFLCRQLGAELKGKSSIQISERVAEERTVVGEQGTGVFTKSQQGDKYFKFPVVVRRIEPTKIVTDLVE